MGLTMKHTDKGKLLTSIILETFKLNGLLVIEGDQLIKELGVTSARWKVLGALSTNANPMTVPDIARMMGQSRQAVQRLSTEMKEGGLIVALPNPNHKRADLLALTQHGRETYAQIMQKQIPWINSIGNEFQESDLRLTSSVLNKLIKQLEL